MTGPVSTSVRTAVGVRAATPGIWLRRSLVGPEGSHDATGGTVGGQVGYRWQAGTWVFGLEAQGNWADFSGSNVSLVCPGFRNRTERRCVRPVHRSGRLCRQQRPALRQGRCCGDLEQLSHQHVSAARSLASPATTPAGAARSAPASNTPSLRTGRLASSTTTCSCRTDLQLHHAGRRSLRHRPHPSGRRSRHRPPELPVRRPGHREVLISRYLRIKEAPGAAPGLFFAAAGEPRVWGGAGKGMAAGAYCVDGSIYQMALLAALAVLTLGVIPDRRRGAVIAVGTCVVAAFVLHFVAP